MFNEWTWIAEFFLDWKLNLENEILKNWTLMIEIFKGNKQINKWNNDNNNQNNI